MRPTPKPTQTTSSLKSLFLSGQTLSRFTPRSTADLWRDLRRRRNEELCSPEERGIRNPKREILPRSGTKQIRIDGNGGSGETRQGNIWFLDGGMNRGIRGIRGKEPIESFIFHVFRVFRGSRLLYCNSRNCSQAARILQSVEVAR